MTSQIPIALVALIVLSVELDANAVSLNDAETSVSIGQLYAIGETGALHGLHKREIQALQNDEQHFIRLHFNDGSPSLDMHLRQASVWNKNSEFVVRSGDRTFKIPHNRDSSCYLHGRVPSHGGAVSINRCGTVTGNIHTPGHHFRLEEMPPSEDGSEQQNTKLKVTKKKTENEIIDGEEFGVLDDMDDMITLEPFKGDNSKFRVKRETDSAVMEVAIFVDRGYHDYLYYEMGITKLGDMIQWFVDKWNQIDSIFGAGPDTIGADISIQVKMIELWLDNPENYPEDRIGVSPRLGWFCGNTPNANNFDQKVLYTKDTGGHQMGLAYSGGTCLTRYKCNLVKSPTQNVRVELHELGHSIGFPHDTRFGDCGDDKGFMGLTDTYRYLPCYKRKLISQLRRPSMSCLFQKNVPEKGMNDY